MEVVRPADLSLLCVGVCVFTVFPNKLLTDNTSALQTHGQLHLSARPAAAQIKGPNHSERPKKTLANRQNFHDGKAQNSNICDALSFNSNSALFLHHFFLFFFAFSLPCGPHTHTLSRASLCGGRCKGELEVWRLLSELCVTFPIGAY